MPALVPRALLLAKIEQEHVLDWDAAVAPEDVLVPLIDEGLVEVATSRYGLAAATLTTRGKAMLEQATPEALCGPSTDGGGRAQAALWLWLLVHGAEPSRYGDDSPYGARGEIAHLLICGLDLAASSTVRDDSWQDWGGTYVGFTGHTAGVSGSATCQCARVREHPVQAEVTSIATLIHQLVTR